MALSNILTGWGNLVLDTFHLLDPDLQKEAEARLSQCNTCEMRIDNTCNKRQFGTHVKTGEKVRGCGCHLAAKALDPDSSCPLGKWDKFVKNETQS